MLKDIKSRVKALWVNQFARYGLYSFSACASLGLFHAFGPELSDSEVVNTIIEGINYASIALTSLGGTVSMAATGFADETHYQLNRTETEISSHSGRIPIETVLAYYRNAPCGQFGIEAVLKEKGTNIAELLGDSIYLDQEVSRYMDKMNQPEIKAGKKSWRLRELRGVLRIAEREDLYHLVLATEN
jgi:hypothetical protein